MNPLSTLISYLGQPVIFGIPIWAFVVVFILIFIKIIRDWRPKAKQYKNEDLTKEIKKDFDYMVSAFLHKQPLNYRWKRKLKYGDLVKGDIKKMAVFNKNFLEDTDGKLVAKTLALLVEKEKVTEKIVKGKIKKTAKKKETNTKDVNKKMFYITYFKSTIRGKIQSLINFRPLRLIVSEHVVKRINDDVIINFNASPNNFFGIEIFSEYARELITDTSFKKQLEITLEEQMNLLHKQTYLETNTLQSIARHREKAKIEDEKYDKHIEKDN